MKARWIDESVLNIAGDRATVRTATWNGPKMKPGEPIDILQSRGKNTHPNYDSKLEQAYDQYLAALKFAGEIRAYWYHSITFHLPGGMKHKPDFVILPIDSWKLNIHECKGWSKNLRDGMTRLHIASGIFTCFDWSLVKRKKGQWEVTAI